MLVLLQRAQIKSIKQMKFLSRPVVLNRGSVKKFLGGREPSHALQHRNFLTGMCPF